MSNFHPVGHGQMPGITLRQWLAGQALAGICAHEKLGTETASQQAEWAVDAADATLARLLRPVEVPPVQPRLVERPPDCPTCHGCGQVFTGPEASMHTCTACNGTGLAHGEGM